MSVNSLAAVLSPIAKSSNFQGILEAAAASQSVVAALLENATVTHLQWDPREEVADEDPPVSAVAAGVAAAVQGLVASAAAAQDDPVSSQDKLCCSRPSLCPKFTRIWI